MLDIILRIESLCKYFPIRKSIFSRQTDFVHAVDNVSLSIERYETLGLIGESGCGKSTLARTILRLIDPSSGKIFFNGTDLLSLSGKDAMKTRRNMQMVYQNPFLPLNPKRTISRTVGETIYYTSNYEEVGFKKTGLGFIGKCRFKKGALIWLST